VLKPAPLFTPENARLYAAKSVQIRQQKAKANRLVLEALRSGVYDKAIEPSRLVAQLACLQRIAKLAVRGRGETALEWANVFRKLGGNVETEPEKPKQSVQAEIAPEDAGEPTPES